MTFELANDTGTLRLRGVDARDTLWREHCSASEEMLL